MKFEELNLLSPILKALDKQGFDKPTEIQEKVIPLAIEGKDILGCAQTGSGKTLAFALPLLNKMYQGRLAKRTVEGKQTRLIKTLVIAPTRELAIQIGEAFAPYCTNTNFKHTVITGGVNQFHQVKALEKGVDVLISTPGRLEDLISQGVIKLSYVEFLVLDEADIMLDMGFMPDIKKVLKRITKARQTLLFSATMPKKIRDLSNEILNQPKEITVHKVASTTDKIEQRVYHIASSNRRKLLQFLVKQDIYKSIIVFVKTKDDTEYILEYVKSAKVSCDSIHRNRSQNARQRSLKSLKEGKIKVLVATDIASRGLDVNGLSLVINYNVPKDPETYVHRIGRTGRAGEKGIAITFCIKSEKEKFLEVEKLIGKKVTIMEDIDYKDEIISKTKILGYSNFEENGKEKYKKKTRKSVGKKKFYGKKK